MSTSLTCTLHLSDTDTDTDTHTLVTITGARRAVLRVVARLHGLDADGVEIRDNPQSDDGLPRVMVDREQAESYPAYLAEIEPPPGWENRAVARAKREGVLP